MDASRTALAAPGEVVDTIAFLLSEGALTLTGQLLPVSNGFVFA